MIGWFKTSHLVGIAYVRGLPKDGTPRMKNWCSNPFAPAVLYAAYRDWPTSPEHLGRYYHWHEGDYLLIL